MTASPIVFTSAGTALVYTFASNRGEMNSPEGSSVFEFRTAAATSVDVMPRACALAGSTTMLIWRCRPPLIDALATPGMPSSTGSMLFSA